MVNKFEAVEESKREANAKFESSQSVNERASLSESGTGPDLEFANDQRS